VVECAGESAHLGKDLGFDVGTVGTVGFFVQDVEPTRRLI
jgi:hypothetical protein